MKKRIALLLISVFLAACGTDDNSDSSSENPEVITNPDSDTGELRMIEITFKSGDNPPLIEKRKVYFNQDRPIVDSLWRFDSSLGIITSYEYASDNKLVKTTATFYDSDQSDRIDIHEFTYDGQDRIIRSLFSEDINASNGFVSDVTYSYNANSIAISNNFNTNYSWMLDNEGRVLRDESSNGSFAQAIYSGSNLVEMDTNYRPEENYQFEFDVATPVLGGFDDKTILGNNVINSLIYNTGRIADGGYEIFQENYITGFTYSYLLNGVPEVQNVQYTYEFDTQGRLKKRTEDSDFYPARELIDYEYFYND